MIMKQMTVNVTPEISICGTVLCNVSQIPNYLTFWMILVMNLQIINGSEGTGTGLPTAGTKPGRL